MIDIEPMGFRLLRHVTRQQAFLEIDVPPPAPITVHVINGQTGAGLPGAAVFWLGEIQDVQDETIRFEELGWSQAVPTECGTEFCDSAPEGTMRVHVRRKGYVSQNLRNVRVRPRTGCRLDVRMQIAGRILVRVAGEGASRAEGHSLHVHPEPRSGRATYFFRIVGRECRVDDLEAGTYRLWVAGPGGRPLSTPKLVSVAGGVEEVVEVEVPR